MKVFQFGLLLVLLCASQAWAQSASSLSVGPVLVELEAPWPESVSKGYQPLRVELANQEGRNELVELVISGYRDGQLRLSRDVQLGPGERVALEILVPAYLPWARAFSVEVTVGSEVEQSGDLGKSHRLASELHNVMVLSGGNREPGRSQKWSEELSPPEQPTTHFYYGDNWRRQGIVSEKDWLERGRVLVTDVDFDEMSRDWRAYTSLDFAVVDLDSGAPDGPRLEALLAWVRSGGELMLAGAELNESLAMLDAVQPWLEDRFQISDEGGIRTYQCGFGRIFVAPIAGLLDDERARTLVLKELRQQVRTGWTPSPRGSRSSGLGMRVEVPGLGSMPFRSFVAFIILFGILIWPVNFMFVKRLGKPTWMLVTIPAIALTASLMVLAYGVIAQGLDIKTSSTSVSILDLRSGSVTGVDVRAMYAGMAPGRGQVTGAGTALFPLGYVRNSSRAGLYRIEHINGEERYGAEFLPSRKHIEQLLLSNRRTQLRVELGPNGSLENGLGVPIEELLLRGLDGAYWALEEPLQNGDSGQLVQVLAPKDVTKMKLVMGSFGIEKIGDLPLGTFTAQLSQAAFPETLGLELNELRGNHQLLGVLPKTANFPSAQEAGQ